MQLSMTVLRCPDQVAPEARTVSGGEFHVGRGPDVDWILPDPDRLLSKRHFAVAFRGGGWQVADTSTNGTYLNTEADSIGRGAARSLRDGDRLRLGAYEIEIRLVDQPVQGDAMGGFAGGAGSGARSGQSPFGDPFAEDLLAPSPAARRPFDEPAYQNTGMTPGSAQLPHDFDPLAPDHDDEAFGGFRGSVQADHSSSMSDAMVPPPIAGYSAPHAGGIIPGDDLLPDDWDKDLLEGIASPPQTPSPGHPAAPEPAAFSRATPHPAAPAPMAAPFAAPFAAPLGNPPLEPPPRETPPWAASPLESSPFDAPPSGVPPSGSAQPRAAAPELLEPLDFTDPLAPAEPLEEVHPEPVPVPPAMAAPVVRQRAPRPATPRATPLDGDPFSELDPPQARQPIPAPGQPPSPPPFAPLPADLTVSPFDEPSDPLRSEPASPARPAPRGPASPPKVSSAGPPVDDGPVDDGKADNSGMLAAFFKGAELGGATPADPISMMAGLGMAFRALVSGLRSVLIARATIKGEFRIEQTMIRARGNNPLKFSANDDDALTALLGVGRRTDMAPAAAIEDALRDLRMHELATMAAMQVAVRAILDELSPDKIRAGTDQGGMAVLPAQRKARAWDAFEARHNSVVRALVDDFDSIFGKSFARAYERALDEISTRERQ
jgi:type VI secretion system FHA domain protein